MQRPNRATLSLANGLRSLTKPEPAPGFHRALRPPRKTRELGPSAALTHPTHLTYHQHRPKDTTLYSCGSLLHLHATNAFISPFSDLRCAYNSGLIILLGHPLPVLSCSSIYAFSPYEICPACEEHRSVIAGTQAHAVTARHHLTLDLRQLNSIGLLPWASSKDYGRDCLIPQILRQ